MMIMRKFIYIITACTVLNFAPDFSLSAMAYNKTEEKTEIRLAAKNKNLELYVNDSSGEIALKDKNGSMWYSSPQNAENDLLPQNLSYQICSRRLVLHIVSLKNVLIQVYIQRAVHR